MPERVVALTSEMTRPVGPILQDRIQAPAAIASLCLIWTDRSNDLGPYIGGTLGGTCWLPGCVTEPRSTSSHVALLSFHRWPDHSEHRQGSLRSWVGIRQGGKAVLPSADVQPLTRPEPDLTVPACCC